MPTRDSPSHSRSLLFANLTANPLARCTGRASAAATASGALHNSTSRFARDRPV